MIEQEDLFNLLHSKNKDEIDKAFQMVYEKYYRLVFYIASKYISNAEDKEDVVQSVFMKLYNSLNKITSSVLLPHYISAIAKNESINLLKKKQEKVSLDDIEEIGVDDKKMIIDSELSSLLEEVDANIITLKIYYGYTFKEIADLINKNQDFVVTRYYRALEKLKKVL